MSVGTYRPELARTFLSAARIKAEQATEAEHALEAERYRHDIVAWIRECCWTFDTRFKPGSRTDVVGWVPFDLYQFQADYINWLEARYLEHEDAFTEKSRDMGVTWCIVAWLVWHWLFDETFTALVGSYDEAACDNFLHESVFGKIDGLISRLPAWQQALARWDPHHPESRKHLTVRNRSNENTLSGASADGRFSRGARYSVIFLDEFSKWQYGEQVLQSTADASPFRCFVATPEGMNSSGRLRHSERVKVMTLHWRMHPLKDNAWYERECARRTPEQVAQELDISYERSVFGLVFPEWHNVPKGNYPYVPGWPLFVSWDFGLADQTAMIWWQLNPNSGRYRMVDCYANSGKAITFYVPFLSGDVPSFGPYDYTESDVAKVASHQGWGGAVHYGDPAGGQRNQVTASSVFDELRKHNVYVNSRPDRNTFQARWETTKLFLPRMEGWNEATCLDLHSALLNARFPERNRDIQNTSAISKPIHDWTEAYRTALEFFCVNVHGLEERDQAQSVRVPPQPSAFMLRSGAADGMASIRAALRSRR